jgi:dihydroorotase
MSIEPARILGLGPGLGELKVGSGANFTVIQPDEEWTVRKSDFVSKSKNSCFIGRKLKSRVKATVCDGVMWKW